MKRLELIVNDQTNVYIKTHRKQFVFVIGTVMFYPDLCMMIKNNLNILTSHGAGVWKGQHEHCPGQCDEGCGCEYSFRLS